MTESEHRSKDKIEHWTKLIKFDKNDKIGRNRQNWTKFDLALQLHHNAKVHDSHLGMKVTFTFLI